MVLGLLALRWTYRVLAAIVLVPLMLSVDYFRAGHWITGLVAIACAPAILWVIIIGWRHAKYRNSLTIQLYSGSASPDAAGPVAGYDSSSSGSGQQLSGLCRYCDKPMNPSSPICPKCGRKN